MLTDYINAAMRHAEYEDLGGGEGWYGHIPGFQGLWANAPTIDETKQELRDTLEDWIVFSLVNGYGVPVVDDIDLMASKVA